MITPCSLLFKKKAKSKTLYNKQYNYITKLL